MTDVCILYYSRTGTTHAVARQAWQRLDAPTVERIRPVEPRSYPNWLARSFVPGSSVPIDPVDATPADYDAVLLGTPKWTLSCPPVTRLLADADFSGTTLGLFLTYGGFDYARYAQRLVERLEAEGATVAATLLAKRDRVGDPGTAEGVGTFCEAVVEAAGSDSHPEHARLLVEV